MYFNKINSIYNFNDNAIRNTPIFTDNNNELLDIADDQFDLDVARKIINKHRKSHFDTIAYHAVDYVFNQQGCFQSRFSDGSYPVWYGSLDQETTFYETIFHWHRTIIEAMHYDDDTPIVTNRSLFSVGCNAMLIDLRKSIDEIPELTDKNLKSYKTTQTLGKEIYKQNQSGIYTYSARKNKGENIAIFNRKALSNVEHLKNIEYKYDFKKSKVFVVDKSSKKLILEI